MTQGLRFLVVWFICCSGEPPEGDVIGSFCSTERVEASIVLSLGSEVCRVVHPQDLTTNVLEFSGASGLHADELRPLSVCIGPDDMYDRPQKLVTVEVAFENIFVEKQFAEILKRRRVLRRMYPAENDFQIRGSKLQWGAPPDVECGGRNRMLVQIHDAVVDGPRGTIRNGSHYLHCVGGGACRKPEGHKPSSPVERRDTVAVVAQPGAQSANYFHFLANTLPPLLRLQQLGVLGLADAIYVDVVSGFAQKLLALAQLDIGAKVWNPRDTVFLARQALVPRPASLVPDRLDAEVLRQGFQHVAPARALGMDQPAMVVYAHRDEKEERHIANWPHMLSLLQRMFGEQQVVMHTSATSTDQAIAWCQAAHLLVGPHGSGLVHAIWLPPGAAVLEIAAFGDPISVMATLYPEISANLGLRHYMYLVPVLAGTNVGNTLAMNVSLDAFEQLLDRVQADDRGGNEL